MIVTDPFNPAQRIDPFTISYSIYQVSKETDVKTLLAPPDRAPARFDVGHYFVDERIDPGSTIGDYAVEWNFRRLMTSAPELVPYPFSIVGLERIVSLNLTEIEQFLIQRLRILLRDNNPDRYYRFQPPTSDARLQGFTEKFGFIWQDDELASHLETSLQDINFRPPTTMWELENSPRTLLALLLVGAAKYALSSLETMWIGEEFNYSINGVSLDIDKAAKYGAQKEYYAAQFTEMVEQYKLTINFVKGLSQPRYSIGLASHLGPFSRRGVQSLRNFAGGGGGTKSTY